MSRRLTHTTVRAWFPLRKKAVHKGDCGRVYILGGSRGMVGAPLLASWGAVKSGAGLVRLGTVKSQQSVAAKRAPLEVTTDALPENKRGHLSGQSFAIVHAMLRKFTPDVTVVGPGLGQSNDTTTLVKRLLQTQVGGIVLDADGLNVLAPLPRKFYFPHPTVITPHEGELARLLGRSVSWIRSHREQTAVEAARRWRCVCVLKGAGTVVTNGSEVWINSTGNPAMASGGMGDVLSGVIAALWGQLDEQTLRSGLRAAGLGVFLHGLAGDWAFKKYGGVSVRASDVADLLPRALSLLMRRPSRHADR